MRPDNDLQADIGNDPRRLGKVTASKVHDLMAKTKNGYAASRRSYMKCLAAQRVTGKAKRVFATPAMRRGTELEPEAKEAYEVATGRFVTDPDFVDHKKIFMFGASPDGIVLVDE
jgi:hypothetical protein